MTLARHLALAGHAVGFYESDAPVSVRMYGSGLGGLAELAPLADPARPVRRVAARLRGLLEVTLVQALPLPLLLASGSWRGAGGVALRGALLAGG